MNDKYQLDLYQPCLKTSDFVEYLVAKNTISRQQHDYYLEKALPELHGKVLEIGASYARNYSQLAINATDYVKSNMAARKDIIKIDATNIDMPDNSFDGIVCLCVLEHIEDFRSVISEFYRVLTPGGKLILTVPFVYYYHGAPDDYYRFSVSALKELHKDFSSVKISAIGNYWDNIAHVLQGPDWIKGKRKFSPWYLRLLGLPFYLKGRSIKEPDSYAILYGVIAEK